MLLKLIRAALISAAATVGSVVLLRHLESRADKDHIRLRAPGDPLITVVDADGMTPDEREALLSELGSHL